MFNRPCTQTFDIPLWLNSQWYQKNRIGINLCQYRLKKKAKKELKIAQKFPQVQMGVAFIKWLSFIQGTYCTIMFNLLQKVNASLAKTEEA